MQCDLGMDPKGDDDDLRPVMKKVFQKNYDELQKLWEGNKKFSNMVTNGEGRAIVLKNFPKDYEINDFCDEDNFTDQGINSLMADLDKAGFLQ